MNVFGSTRSSVHKDHALIAADSFVRSPLPGWSNTEGIILISPQMGARFTQYLALMSPSAVAGPALPGVQRMVYVLEGGLTVRSGKKTEHTLTDGGFVFCPPDGGIDMRATTATRLNIFEKRYVPIGGHAQPELAVGQEQAIDGAPFLGDPDAILKTLLPQEPTFDLAVNVFTFRPGAALPMVEVHVMEHGLLMLQGQGVYRLGDAWYPVHAGDVIWMASFCPQWFVAMGKEPARYLYYKDVNRDPFEAKV
jgi:(S)-ureidoglycine aminohydrolase